MDNEHETLIEGIVTAMGGITTAQDAADQAAKNLSTTQAGSIRAVGKLLAGINAALDSDAVDSIATGVATALAKGKTNVFKARRSEIKLLVERRADITGVIDALDEWQEHEQETDEKFRLNIRARTLAGLRSLRKDPDTTVDIFIASEKEKYHAEPDPVDKAERALRSLRKMSALMEDDGSGSKSLTDAADKLIQGLEGLVSGITPKADPEEPEEPEEELPEDVPPVDDIVASVPKIEDPVEIEAAEIEALEGLEDTGDGDDYDADIDALLSDLM